MLRICAIGTRQSWSPAVSWRTVPLIAEVRATVSDEDDGAKMQNAHMVFPVILHCSFKDMVIWKMHFCASTVEKGLHEAGHINDVS